MSQQYSTVTLSMHHQHQERQELLVEEAKDWVRLLQHRLNLAAQIRPGLLEAN